MGNVYVERGTICRKKGHKVREFPTRDGKKVACNVLKDDGEGSFLCISGKRSITG